MSRRGRLEQPRRKRQWRAQWARILLVVCVAALGYALTQVQVFTFETFARIAKENRLRPIVVRAPRGTIYDRHGRVVAENTVGYQVSLMPAPADSIRASLVRLQPVLGLSEDDIIEALRRYDRDPHLPVPVLRDAPREAIARLEERRYKYPEVLVHEYPKRRYPAGQAIAHVIGYVAEISETELEQPRFADYRQGRLIGKDGLERNYEEQLGGVPGVQYLEVDALGRIKSWLPEEVGIPPIPGHDLQLHLDLDLQRYVMHLFDRMRVEDGRANLQAAFVALDPQTGGVLAMYSTPSFDPNSFIGGIQPDLWRELTQHPSRPLLGRAASSAQPPGSTFKLATAAMALRLGVIEPQEYMPVACRGGMSYGGRYARCWSVHGAQNLITGLQNSCDVYFYQVGIRIGFQRFLELGTRIGLSERTGIDLPNEVAPIFPEGKNWWVRTYGYQPNDNEIMSLSIGQGAVTLTPLKLAHLFVPLAREDGGAPPPRLAMTDDTLTSVFDYGITAEDRAVLRQGMRRVVGPGGTARLSRLQDWDFMGKTGTAENSHGADHAWFVGIGGPKGEPPEIIAALLVMHGESGSQTASGPVANAVNFYLDRKHGREFEPYPTPRERLPRGLEVDWEWLRSPVDDTERWSVP